MSSPLEKHNQVQIRYFENTYKPRMAPQESPYLRRQVEHALRFAGLRPSQSILEVGCGMGRYTFLLAQLGFAVEGQDLTAKLLEHFRDFDGGRFNIPLHCGDIAFPPDALQGRFDAILGFFVLHHMHDLEACFRGMRRTLRPGGMVLFVEPNPYNPLYYAQMLLTPGMTWEGDKGMFQMKRKRIFSAMELAGLTEPQCERFGFLPPFLINLRGGSHAETVLERFAKISDAVIVCVAQ